MNAPARALSSRRDILKGGALIVGFNIAENIDSPLAQPLLEPPTSAIAARPDPAMLDSWIAIHADNTATVFMGKVELGQFHDTELEAARAERTSPVAKTEPSETVKAKKAVLADTRSDRLEGVDWKGLLELIEEMRARVSRETVGQWK
jgi:hypothetical protein